MDFYYLSKIIVTILRVLYKIFKLIYPTNTFRWHSIEKTTKQIGNW